jgi:DHA3 family tetracycline resistance protein-like MFS transporter
VTLQIVTKSQASASTLTATELHGIVTMIYVKNITFLMTMIRPLNPALLYVLMRGVGAFASALVLTYELAYHTVVVGLDPFQLVLVGVVLESMTFLFEIPTGIVADLYSRRLSVIIGIFLTGCGFLIETLVPSFAVVLLAQVVWGIGFTFFSGADAAWITDEIGVDQAHSVFLRATQIGQVLSIAGTFCGAALSQISIALPVVVGAALFLLLGASLCFCMPETGFQPVGRGQRAHVVEHMFRPLRESARFVRVHPLLWIILLLGTIIGLSLGGFDRLYTAHFLQDVALPPIGRAAVIWLGIINGVVSMTTLAGMEIVRRRYRTTDQGVIINILLVLYSGMVIGSFCFALSGAFVLAVAGFCLSQTLRNIGRPLLILWINQNAEKQIRATLISAYWQANALGQIAGSPLLGWLATTTSLRLALGVGTSIYTATLGLLLVARRRWKRVRQDARLSEV